MYWYCVMSPNQNLGAPYTQSQPNVHYSDTNLSSNDFPINADKWMHLYPT